MAVKPALTTRRCAMRGAPVWRCCVMSGSRRRVGFTFLVAHMMRGAPVGRRCVMSGSRRRVVSTFLVAHNELELDAVSAEDAGDDGCGERSSWQRGLLIGVLLLASSTHRLMVQDGRESNTGVSVLLQALLLQPLSGTDSAHCSSGTDSAHCSSGSDSERCSSTR